jgi:hypothetical protein
VEAVAVQGAEETEDSDRVVLEGESAEWVREVTAEWVREVTAASGRVVAAVA